LTVLSTLDHNICCNLGHSIVLSFPAQLAAKYEEIFPPELVELAYITDGAYIRAEIVEMESVIAKALDYHLTVPTIHSFLCRYLKAAHADRQMVQLTCYLAERSLQEYCMLEYCPSVIAATSVLIARKSLKRHAWSPTLVKYTNYDEDDLEECAEQMDIYIDNDSGTREAVKLKYSKTRYGGVSKLTIVI
jgi:G2/mitotic-specific cyclin-B, other